MKKPAASRNTIICDDCIPSFSLTRSFHRRNRRDFISIRCRARDETHATKSIKNMTKKIFIISCKHSSASHILTQSDFSAKRHPTSGKPSANIVITRLRWQSELFSAPDHLRLQSIDTHCLQVNDFVLRTIHALCRFVSAFCELKRSLLPIRKDLIRSLMPKASFIVRLDRLAKQDAHLARYFSPDKESKSVIHSPCAVFGIGEIYMENQIKREERVDSFRFFLCYPTFPIRENHNVRLTLRFQKQSPLPDSS